MMTLEQLGVLQRSQLEIWVAITDETVSGVNRLIGLNLQAIKVELGETKHCLHEAVGTQDAGEWWNAQARYLQPAREYVSGYMRNFVETGVETQNEIARALQRHGDEVRRQWGFVTENFVDTAPPGAEAAVNFSKASIGPGMAAAEAAGEAGASRTLMPSDVGALDTTTR